MVLGAFISATSAGHLLLNVKKSIKLLMPQLIFFSLVHGAHSWETDETGNNASLMFSLLERAVRFVLELQRMQTSCNV